jgi:hypothetical protein
MRGDAKVEPPEGIISAFKMDARLRIKNSVKQT